MSKYDDIINYPYPPKNKSHNMSMSDRAAQFSPFSALTGYDDCISESNRITQDYVEISDSEKEIINSNLVKANENHTMVIEIKYFVKDISKDGGEYKTVQGTIKRINEAENKIILSSNQKIDISSIIDVRII